MKREGRLWDDPPRSGRKRGRTRRAAETTVRAWRTSGKLEDADRLAVSLLYTGADLLDETTAVTSEESAYVQAIVLGRVTEVVRFVSERVAGDVDGPALADLLAAALDAPDPGPAH